MSYLTQRYYGDKADPAKCQDVYVELARAADHIAENEPAITGLPKAKEIIDVLDECSHETKPS